MIPEPTTTQTKAAVPMYSASHFLKIIIAPNQAQQNELYFGEEVTT
jgi:hypothetical protein